jgi:hypothetical protein
MSFPAYRLFCFFYLELSAFSFIGLLAFFAYRLISFFAFNLDHTPDKSRSIKLGTLGNGVTDLIFRQWFCV